MPFLLYHQIDVWPGSGQPTNEIHGIEDCTEVERTVSAAVIDEHSGVLRPDNGDVRVAVPIEVRDPECFLARGLEHLHPPRLP